MIQLIFKAIVTGFILSIMIGPVFFLLLETSIKKGIRAAIAFDLGVLISDCLYILIAYIFYSEVQSLAEGSDQHFVKIIGGTLFIAYGVASFFKKSKGIKKDAQGNLVKEANDYKMLALKGFLLNFVNPLVIFYWFSVMTLAEKAEGMNTTPLFTFLSVILITFFGIDLLKIFGAKKLRPLVTNAVMKGLNRLIGIVFVGFGIFLFIQGWRGWNVPM
ncbi:MAG: LysE family transporter [Crocinitomicaceae bacterium]|nr:LysE family transporter [Crocinitomicaceae bacterium]MDG2465465.1 LysE family transporter [Crocinitomicaceae bacterium]